MDDRAGLVALIAVFGVLYAWGLDRPELSHIDECRSGVIVRDMVEGGHWLLPRTPDGYLSEKPPAYYYQVALASTLFGTNEWTLRGVSVLMALATLAVTWFWAAMYGSTRVAMLAVVALGSNVLVSMWARSAMVDMTLTFFVTAGLASYFAARLGNLAPGKAAVLCGLSLGLAVLSKGPLGLALPLAVIAGDVLVRSRGRFWKAPIPWGATALAAGLVVGVSLLWYLPAILAGGSEFLNTCLLDENVYMPLGIKHGIAGSHVKPPLYYPSRQLLGFLPVAAFLPETVRWLFRRDAGVARAHAGAWLGFGFLVLMAASNKRIHYLLPLQPAGALLVAMAVGRALEEGPSPALRWGVRISGGALALGSIFVLSLAILGPEALAMGRFMDDPDFLAGCELPLALLGVMMLGLGAAQIVTAGRGTLAMIRTVALMGFLAVAVRSVLYDGVRGNQDAIRPFVDRAMKIVPPGSRVAAVGSLKGYGVHFYWPGRLSDPADADFYFASYSLPGDQEKDIVPLAMMKFSRDRKSVVLVRGRPPPKETE